MTFFGLQARKEVLEREYDVRGIPFRGKGVLTRNVDLEFEEQGRIVRGESYVELEQKPTFNLSPF